MWKEAVSVRMSQQPRGKHSHACADGPVERVTMAIFEDAD